MNSRIPVGQCFSLRGTFSPAASDGRLTPHRELESAARELFRAVISPARQKSQAAVRTKGPMARSSSIKGQ